MAKYMVNFSCGHAEEKELFGPTKERARKIEWWERECVCSACYREMKEVEMAAKFDEVEMLYRDYKNGEFANCKTKPGSYNGEKKTIVVLIPKKEEDA